MSPASRVNARPRFAVSWAPLLIAVVVGFVFRGALHGEFLAWDDDLNITGNAHLREFAWPQIKWMFTDFAHMRRYVPLTWLDWSIDHALFGLTPYSAHVGNLVLHVANALLLYFLIRELLLRWNRSAGSVGWISGCAGLAALAWAVHPLRVEVVAWASGRIYCQAIFFLLGATLAYLRAGRVAAGQPAQRTWLNLAFIAFTASLLTYPLALGFVAVLVVIDYYVLRRFDPPAARGELWREKIAFLIITIAVLAVSLLARYAAKGWWEPPPTLEQVSLFARTMRAFYLWAYYVWKPFVPFGLAPVYTTLIDFDPFSAPAIGSALGVLAVTAWLTVRRRQWPGCCALWLCHLILLTPMLGLTESSHYPNDRYSYLEGMVWAVALAGLLLVLKNRLLVVVTAAAIAVCGLLSVAQIRIWHDSETLFRRLLEQVGDAPYRADVAMRLGELLRGEERWTEAAENYRESLRLDFTSRRAAIPHFGLAKIAEHARNWPDAAAHYREAIRLQPDFAEAYVEFGRLLLEVGQVSDALLLLSGAVQIEPDNATAHQLRGAAFVRTGDTVAAIAEFEAALRLRPAFVLARCQLTSALTAAGRFDEAVAQGGAAVQTSPHFAPAHLALGLALRDAGRIPEAVATLTTALRLDPKLSDAADALKKLTPP